MDPDRSSGIGEDGALAPGTRILGAYEIVTEVGGGGMGRVYCARHVDLGESRAIKVVRRDAGLSAKMEELLVSEARALTKLNHDGLVRCHELLRDEQRLYLVMEYVDGPSLKRLLLRGPLPDDEVLALRERLLASLSAMHAAGLVHRDLSPANIVLPDGAPERAKIVDFGLAVVDAGDGKRAFQGNPTYASPEQYGLHGGKVDHRSDLYSLGLVLAESCIGEALDRGTTVAEHKAFRQARPELPDYLPATLRHAILPLLEPNAGKRTASAQAALNEPLPSDNAAVHEVDRHANRTKTLATVFCLSAVVAGIAAGTVLWLMNYTGVISKPTWMPGSKSSAVGAPGAAPAPVVAGQPSAPAPPPPQPSLPSTPTAKPVALRVTRADAVRTAEQLSSFEWRPQHGNLEAKCRTQVPYKSRWREGQTVRGLPYDWGGIDGPNDFAAKLGQGQAAGSRAAQGITSCTAGIDCSGFVTYCWGQRGSHAYTTTTLNQITDTVNGSVVDALRPGDALNRPGKHVILFAGYQPDGRPLLYEAAGAPGRVVRRDDLSWSRLRAYQPVRLRTIVD